MVRIATVNDAEQLNILNDEFNGESETSIDNIRNSLMNNKQEVVIVADEDDMLVGFVCVQLKKSFCYDEYMPEITEVYVKPAYRKRGLASEMITFAEAYCSKNYPLHQYELLTGQENLVAQTVYNKLGYVDDNELHLSKRVKRYVADGLFCREIDGLFCRSSPDIIVRRRCVLSHKRRGWLQPSPSFRYSRNLALQDELYHPVINNGPAVLVCVDKRLGTGPVNQSRDAG